MRWLLSFVLLAGWLAAQTAQLEFSQAQRLSSRLNKFKIIGRNESGIVVRMYGTEDVMEVYDNNLKRISSTRVELKGQDGLLQYVGLTRNGALLYYLSSDKRSSRVMMQRVNLHFKETGYPQLVDSIADSRDMVDANLRFRASLDQSKLLVYYPHFARGVVEKLQLVCLTDAGEALWRMQLYLNRPEAELEKMKVTVHADGAASVTFVDTAPRDARDEPTRITLYHVAANGNLHSYTYTLRHKLFDEIYTEADNRNGTLLITGFYDKQEDKRKEAAAYGFFNLAVNPQTGISGRETYTDFSKEFMTQLTGREGERTPAKLFTFNIKKVIVRADGGALVIAESYLRDVQEVPMQTFQPTMNSFRTVSTYQFNDIICFSVNAAGQTDFHQILRKKQVSEDDNGFYSSFFIMNRRDELRMIFLDEPGPKSSVSDYSLAATGESAKHTLFNQTDWEAFVIPRQSKQLSPDEVVMPSVKGDSFRLVRLRF